MCEDKLMARKSDEKHHHMSKHYKQRYECSQSRLDNALGGHPNVITKIVGAYARNYIVWRQDATPKLVKRQRWTNPSA